MNDSRSLSAPDPVREATGVVSRALRSETRDAVSDAIDEMSGKDREILVLRGIEEMSYAVIAIKLDVSEGALKVRYHRALRRLRGHLPEDLVAAMEDA
jgi:RNA polymerase sigma factor (sigma-70 family)